MSTENANHVSGQHYAGLLTGARAALYDLIEETKPATYTPLRVAYEHVRVLQKAEDQKAAKEAELERQRRYRPPAVPAPTRPLPQRAVSSRRGNWRAMSRHDRERLMLEVLGTGRLTTAELAARIMESRADLKVYDEDMLRMLARLRDTGVIERVTEPVRDGVRKHGGARTRYLYYRNPGDGFPDLAEVLGTFST
jgi:hypothetical protein